MSNSMTCRAETSESQQPSLYEHKTLSVPPRLCGSNKIPSVVALLPSPPSLFVPHLSPLCCPLYAPILPVLALF